MMPLPKNTSELFNFLNKGNFICSQSRKKPAIDFYETLKDEEKFIQLKEYFEHINFFLEKGNGYYHFSRINESDKAKEDKLLKLEKYIDILDLFSYLENPLNVGSRFSPSEIASECKNNVRLQQKLREIYPSIKEYHKKITRIADDMASDGFLEKEDDEQDNYKVLDSYLYIIEIIDKIQIFDEDNESSE